MAGGGFGYGGFGLTTFGQDSWARRVLYLSAPLLYRQADAAQGGVLEKYASGQEASFENLRDRIQRYADLRDPFTARTAYTTSEFVALGKQVVPLGPIETSGSLGRVNAIGAFTVLDRTATFGQQDIGKLLFIRRSNVAANNLQVFAITNIVNDKEVLTEPRTALDSGPMKWEMHSPASLPAGQVEVELRGGDPRYITVGSFINDGTNEYEVVSRQIFWQSVTSNQLLTEREGSDGTIDSQGRLGTSSYVFRAGDVGKWVSIANSGVKGNNGLYEIVSVEGGKAVFAQLTVMGQDNNVFGAVIFRYKQGVSKSISIEVLVKDESSLPLTVEMTQQTSTSFNVRIQAATDSLNLVTTTPSDIVAAIAATPIVSDYIEAATTGLTPEAPVGALAPTLLKPYQPKLDQGPLYWAIRPFARLTLKGPLPLGVVDGDGYDLSVIAFNRVSSSGSPFREGDIGKLLTIGGSTLGNNGVFRISSYISPTDVLVEGILQPVGEASNLYWARRSKPAVQQDPTRYNPLPTEVRTYAEPLLDYLAYDFGLTVDRQQTDLRQRASVRQSSQWMASKGTKLSIEQLATLSGFEATVASLASAEPRPAMGDATHPLPYELFFISSGRSGTLGQFWQEGDKAIFYVALAPFVASDVGKVLQVTNSSAGNNNCYIIAEFIDTNRVVLQQPAIGANLGPAANVVFPDNSDLHYAIGEIYSTILPAFPAMDDVEWDSLALMYDLAGYDVNDRPGIDFPNNGLVTLTPVKTPTGAAATESPIKAGWFGTLPASPNVPNIVSLDPSYGLQITAVATAGTQHTLTIQGEDLRIVKGGEWKLYDSTGALFYFDAFPVQVPPSPSPWTWTLQVTAFAPPASGKCHIEYISPSVVNCEACPTYKLLITLTPQAVLNEGPVAMENMYARCVRSIQQVLPAEAQVYWVYAP